MRDLSGPWLFYDNLRDPYQQANLIDRETSADIQEHLDRELDRLLDRLGDEFLPSDDYVEIGHD